MSLPKKGNGTGGGLVRHIHAYIRTHRYMTCRVVMQATEVDRQISHPLRAYVCRGEDERQREEKEIPTIIQQDGWMMAWRLRRTRARVREMWCWCSKSDEGVASCIVHLRLALSYITLH